MNGKRAKAFRKMAGYHPAGERKYYQGYSKRGAHWTDDENMRYFTYVVGRAFLTAEEAKEHGIPGSAGEKYVSVAKLPLVTDGPRTTYLNLKNEYKKVCAL